MPNGTRKLGPAAGPGPVQDVRDPGDPQRGGQPPHGRTLRGLLRHHDPEHRRARPSVRRETRPRQPVGPDRIPQEHQGTRPRRSNTGGRRPGPWSDSIPRSSVCARRRRSPASRRSSSSADWPKSWLPTCRWAEFRKGVAEACGSSAGRIAAPPKDRPPREHRRERQRRLEGGDGT